MNRRSLDLLRLGSVVPNGLGGPEASMLDLIYSFLLQEYGQTNYSYIHINQIGNDLEELVIKNGKQVYVNVRVPVDSSLNKKNSFEQNLERLKVIDIGLSRIAEYESKIDISVVKEINNRILDSKFDFELCYKEVINKSKPYLSARLFIKPAADRFTFYLAIFEESTLKTKIRLYEGMPVINYIPDFFSNIKWEKTNKISVTGKSSEVMMTFCLETNAIKYELRVQPSGAYSAFKAFMAKDFFPESLFFTDALPHTPINLK